MTMDESDDRGEGAKIAHLNIRSLRANIAS